MKSLKFRVLDIDRNQYIYFNLNNDESMQGLYGRHGLFEDGAFGPKQQSTGVEDKHKREIYEGDRVRDSEHVYTVIWAEDSAGFEAIIGDGGCNNCGCTSIGLVYHDELEII